MSRDDNSGVLVCGVALERSREDRFLALSHLIKAEIVEHAGVGHVAKVEAQLCAILCKGSIRVRSGDSQNADCRENGLISGLGVSLCHNCEMESQ